jgi:hypothetical protein
MTIKSLKKLSKIPFALPVLLVVSIFFASPARSQSDGYLTNQNTTGVVQFGSYHFGDFDSINLGNGGLNVKIPLITLKGRGIDEGLQMIYSSKYWVMRHSKIQLGNQIVDTFGWDLSTFSGPTIRVDTLNMGRVDYSEEEYQCKHWIYDTYGGTHVYDYWNVLVFSNFSYTSADGAKYAFPNRVIAPLNPPIPSVPLCYDDGLGNPM